MKEMPGFRSMDFDEVGICDYCKKKGNVSTDKHGRKQCPKCFIFGADVKKDHKLKYSKIG